MGQVADLLCVVSDWGAVGDALLVGEACSSCLRHGMRWWGGRLKQLGGVEGRRGEYEGQMAAFCTHACMRDGVVMLLRMVNLGSLHWRSVCYGYGTGRLRKA